MTTSPWSRFIAPSYGEANGNQPKLADLRAWLEKPMRIVVNMPQHALGPTDIGGVLVLESDTTRRA